MVSGALIISNSSYRYAFQTQNKYVLIILLEETRGCHTRELSSDVMPYPKQASMLKSSKG